MRHIMPYLALAAALAACREGEPMAPAQDLLFSASAATPVYRVTGGGSVVREDIAGTPRETHGFQAQVDAAGNATGSAEVHFPSDVVKMHIAVRCLVVQGNRAWMSGPVTRSDDPATPIGRVFLWSVQDNGEGRGAPPDRISNFLHRPADNYPPDICLQQWNLTTYPWDNGGVQILTPGALGLDDLVGTWDAVTVMYIRLPDLGDTLDLATYGGHYRMTIAPSGNASLIWFKDGAILEDDPGTVDVIDGRVALRFGGGQGVVLDHQRLTGNALSGGGDYPYGADWDGDGEDDDPTRIFMEFRRLRTGVLTDDLAGTWHATVFRWRSAADPTQVWDLIARGGTYTLTVWRNGYASSDASGFTATFPLVLDGDQVLTRWNDEARAFTFTLDRGTWSFSGPYPYDVDADGTPEPATLEVVLVR